MRCSPQEIAHPRTEDGVVDVLRRAAAGGRTVRPVGAGHSFTPLVQTDDVILSLDHLSGVVGVDPETGDATLWAGTRIRDVADLLAPWNLALPNMGDIDAQSIAGAIATSTHGTGLAYTGYSGIVRGLRVALPDGRIVDASADQEPEIFQAARVGLGVIGVVTQVRLRCVPRFALECRETTEAIDGVLESYLERAERADHIEFFWFPGTPRATVKELTRLPADADTDPMSRADILIKREFLGNTAFGVMDAAAARLPALARPVRSVASRLMAGQPFSDASHRVFVAPRRVRFQETEYAMPLAAFSAAAREVERAIVDSGEQVTFPIEVRVAAADDTWLGTASDRTSVYVAVHRYHRERFGPLLAAVEPVFAAHAGRPHWGKQHSLTAVELARLYPHFDDFRRVRGRTDPDGVLMNAHARRLLVDEAERIH